MGAEATWTVLPEAQLLPGQAQRYKKNFVAYWLPTDFNLDFMGGTLFPNIQNCRGWYLCKSFSNYSKPNAISTVQQQTTSSISQ